MTTVATVLNGARYDLRNYGDMDWDEDLMIHNLNRVINILDQKLVQFNSDQTLNIAYTTPTVGYDYVSAPTGCLEVREVWINQHRKQNVDQQELRYRQQFRRTVKGNGDTINQNEYHKTVARTTTDLSALTSTGATANSAGTYWYSDLGSGTLGTGDIVIKLDTSIPTYWSWIQTKIEFETAFSSAGDEVVIHYDKGTTAFTANTDTMPYNGQYDDAVREILVAMCIHKKYKQDSPTDTVYMDLFDQLVFNDMVNRKFWRKQYRLDF
jgi:hypothetical protein